MFFRRRLLPLDKRDPLRVMFILSSMPLGGAETLLVEIIHRMDRTRFAPELCCLKKLDVLGQVLACQIPAHSGLLRNKYDLHVLPRLVRLMRKRQIDAVVTVGPGDKMFWGRLAARLAGVPVVCSALHSTGYPDPVELLNRLLAPLTDAFIAVAHSHGQFLVAHEGCPAHKVRVIPNGVDADRFRPAPPDERLRASLGILPDQPVVGIVAALRPEKNHELLLRAAVLVRQQVPDVRVLLIGDGPRREALEAMAADLGLCAAPSDSAGSGGQCSPDATGGPSDLHREPMPLAAANADWQEAECHPEPSGAKIVWPVSPAGFHSGRACLAEPAGAATVTFLGTRTDVPELLALVDVVVLTSHMEANPICLLEAMACQKPVVATRVGSVPEIVTHGVTGYLVEPGSAPHIARAIVELLSDREKAAAMGRAGRQRVLQQASIHRTVEGYQQLLVELYSRKASDIPS